MHKYTIKNDASSGTVSSHVPVFVRGVKIRSLYAAIFFAAHSSLLFAELPVPGANFINPGQGVAAMQSDGINMVIDQQSDRAILNWQSFNVGRKNSVTFNQPGSGSVTLNRIFQNDPSKILGTINANGQVYLYNQNGFVFGQDSRVNVASFIPTSLDVDTDQFLKGSILNAIENGQPAFFDTTGNNPGIIKVEAGAEINAERIIMIAPEVINEGNLDSADGQTILAASSDKVYLAASDQDSSLRGLLVEVGTGGTVTNLGNIVAERGNVTLVGLAVNQSGRIRATTSVDRNGSIRLLARDGAQLKNNSEFNNADILESIGIEGGVSNKPTAGQLAVAQNAGKVILGQNSITEITPDSDVITAVPDAQQQLQSKIELVGKEIWLQKESLIRAPSGKVKITATDSPASPMNTSVRNSSYVYMDRGSVIDVSGTDTAVLPMARNSVAVEVRSNELADSPLQRDGVLNGQTVYVDLRKGTDIINYQGALDNVAKTVAERLASGGEITVRSEGDVVQRDGALMDVSGGMVTYEDGYIKESQLVSEGRVFDLSEASKLRHYDAILGVESKKHERWGITETFSGFGRVSSGRFVESFIEGKSAGRVSIAAASAILSDNGLKAQMIIGPYQTEKMLLPDAGELNIDLRRFVDSTQGVTFLAESLLAPIVDDIARVPDSAGVRNAMVGSELLLADTYLQDSGLGKLSINSNGAVVVSHSANIIANMGTDIQLTGSDVRMEGSIVSHAGKVALTAAPVVGDKRANLVVSENSVIDVTGLWINNTSDVNGRVTQLPELIDGGVISLRAEGDVIIGQAALLDASAGAMLDADYTLSAGKGGDISLQANQLGGSSVVLNGRLQSYAMKQGGVLGIEAADILLSDKEPDGAEPNQLILNSRFFEEGGFSRYELTANAGDFVVETVIQPIMKNLAFDNASVVSASNETKLNETVLLIESGASLQDITQQTMLADYLRQPVTIDFSLRQTVPDAANNLTITQQAAINIDPGASLVLNADTSIIMAGVINAPAADVTFNITPPGQETGFLANQSIWLADGSRINVGSSVIFTDNDLSLRTGRVLDAGRVTLNANRGYVIVEDGAVIDVSAKTARLDMLAGSTVEGSSYQVFDVAPDAGGIEMNAAEGIIIDGQLFAGAAGVTGGKGGELAISLDVNRRGIARIDNDALGGDRQKFNFNARDIVFTRDTGNRLGNSVQAGDAIDAALNGVAYLDAEKIEGSGFDSLSVKTAQVITDQLAVASEIRFESDVNLKLKNSVVLTAPSINVNDNAVEISAAYVALGSDSLVRNSVNNTPITGDKAFNVNAALIDVVGDVDITGTRQLSLNASDDMRFIGAVSTQRTDRLTGSLNTAADVYLSARQIYPASNSDAAINISNNPSSLISIEKSGEASAVLSAGGTLTFNADVIKQGGVVKAPLGNIVFNAGDKIVLLPGSVTSVSADGAIIPFGETFNAGSNWNYDVNNNLISMQLADKSIELNAKNIDAQDGSLVDISGGGDIVAWEFVTGPTGSQDLLLADNDAGAFAILPTSVNKYAPYDYLISGDRSQIGEQVYLEAGDGFAAGFYTKLPARYALLPDAKLVTPLSDVSNVLPGRSLSRIDGASVLAGKNGIANTDIVDTMWSAFVVEDGSAARTRSEYVETFASAFFADRLPGDAGALVVNTADSLALSGIIRGDHADGANGSRLDIIANNIEVFAGSGGTVTGNGFIQLSDTSLNKLDVDSIMLGGRRSIGEAVTSVEVQSSEVIIRNNAKLAAPEIILLAGNNIELEAGASLSGKGAINSAKAGNFKLDNNASILGVSVNALPAISRSGNTSGASIILAGGSTLAADNSIFLDGSGDVAFNAGIQLDGGNLKLAAMQVSLGNAPVETSGLNLTSAMLAALNVDRLEISSKKSISVFEDIDLAFNNLELIAPGIDAVSVAGVNVQLSAGGDVVLRQNGEVAQSVAQGEGTFKVDASNIILAGGDESFVLAGFSGVELGAKQDFKGAGFGKGESDGVNVFDFKNASVAIDTPLITGEAGSGLIINTAAAVTLQNSRAVVVDAADVVAPGGELKVNAKNIYLDTNVILPGGLVALNAQGAAAGDDVSLGKKALLDVSGRVVHYADGSVAGSSGGWLTLASANGSINTATTSRMNIASSSVAGNAGTLELLAGKGVATLNAAINTENASGFNGASLRVDLDHVVDMTRFLQQAQVTGFSRSQSYRVRTGDFDVLARASGEASIKAGEIMLAADNGAINITGKLDASGKKAGRMEIYAAGNIDVSAAIFDAFSTIDAQGGKIIIASNNGVLSVDSATQINISGANGENSGKLTLRAPRTDANSDVAINDFTASISGAERIDIEGVAIYNDAVIGAVQQAVYSRDAGDWLLNKNAIASRLLLTNDSRVHYLPGVDVINDGDITISDAVDFYQWQLSSSGVIDEGAFTVRASDNLNINAAISDAVTNEAIYSFSFSGFTFDGPVSPVIKNGESWNYRLVSGADIGSASIMATRQPAGATAGNLILANNVAVRTGKGDIDIASGGDLVLSNQKSVIYTVGQGNGSGRFDAATLDFGAIPDGPQFPNQGGDIRINVANDITAASSSQFFTDWLQRYGGESNLDNGSQIPGMWAIVVNDFEQGIATLGGGDIDVFAGGDIRDLSLSTPQTGQIDVNNDVIVRGGGDINVYAGGDYLSGRLLVDGGQAALRVRGDVSSTGNGLETLIALGDASVSVEAGGNVAIEGIANVTMLPLSTLQSNNFISLANSKNTAYFFTYTDASAVNLLSYYGDVTLNNNLEAIKSADSNRFSDKAVFSWSYYPGDFSATTLAGDIKINNSFSMFPDVDGNLKLLSANNISSRDAGLLTPIFVSVSDVAISALPTITEPDNIFTETDFRLKGGGSDQTLLHDINGPLHKNDAEPLRIVANANIKINDPLKVRSPKQAYVFSGGDITDLGIEIQNINTTDKSLFVAGGDITYSLPDAGNSFVSEGILVTGPGSLTVIAGDSIDLGISKGIRSLGNVDNFTLPEQGADISVFAGIKNQGMNDALDTRAFIATYFKGEAIGDAALIDIDVASYQQQLVEYIVSDTYRGDLRQQVTVLTSKTYANNDQAVVAFKKLSKADQVKIAIDNFSANSVSEQRKLLLDVLFNEVELAAKAQASTGNEKEYARGFFAINQLFSSPQSSETATVAAAVLSAEKRGDINLQFSRIFSAADGNINVLAPNGELNVGFTAVVENASPNAGALGLIVSGRGDLGILTKGNINVNQSRVQALNGGNITMWSSDGDIDAGRGAKSALNIPPPLILVDKQSGQIEVVFPPSVSGSGISAAAFSADQKPGKVTLAAPGGVINASDAGIRSDGDLVLAATKVLGSDNISAGGASVGVPVSTNVTAGLSGLTSSTDNAINGATESIAGAVSDAANLNEGIALVTVELLGSGADD